MKIHIGTDINSNVIHSATVTAANTADITEMPNLLRPDDKVVFADAGYVSDSYKRGARALGMTWKVNDKRKPKKQLSSRNRNNSSVRARVEHCFRVIKCQFGYQKVHYKELEKNRTQVFMLLGLANLYQLKDRLAGYFRMKSERILKNTVKFLFYRNFRLDQSFPKEALIKLVRI